MVSQKVFLIALKVFGIIGAFGCGCYTTYGVMYDAADLRSRILFFYLAWFCVVLLSAELNLLAHRHFKRFGRFATTFTGRALLYIFIGGLLLNGWIGYTIGGYLIALGLANIVGQFAFPSAEDAALDSQTAAAPPI
jgi:hypothetical protein